MTLIQEYPFTETSVLFNVNRGDSDKIWKEFRETPGATRIYVVHQRKNNRYAFFCKQTGNYEGRMSGESVCGALPQMFTDAFTAVFPGVKMVKFR